MNVHVVDGTFELFRAYFGAPSSKGKVGREIGAARAWSRSLLNLLTSDGVTHVGCAYDTEIESFRNAMFDGYKTGEGIEPELWEQFPLAEQVSEALGVVTWRMREFEADDALAAAAHKFESEPGVQRVIICSPDKDLAQCVVGRHIVTADRIRKKVLDEDGVREKFGVSPASIPDYLALVGDTADGIPGLKRWGAKSAGTVLARYEHIENIPDDEGEWDVKVRGAKALAAVLREERENAMLYRKLATLRTDVPLEESLSDLEWKGADRAKVEALCEEFGSQELLNRITRWK